MASDHPAPRGPAPARLCRERTAPRFETDTGDVAGWAHAAALCERCPVLVTCRAELDRVFPGWGPGRRRANPSSVIWAGAIFSPDRRLWTRHGLTRATAAHAARTRRLRSALEPPAAPVSPAAAERAVVTGSIR